MGATVSTSTAQRPAAKQGRRAGPTVREVMTPLDELATVAPEATLREVAALLAARHVAGAPVLAGSAVVGVVSAADLLDFAATAAPDEEEAPDDDEDWEEWEAAAAWDEGSEWTGAGEEAPVELSRARGGDLGTLDEHTAAEVMSRRLVCIAPGASLRQAAQAMRSAGVHRLLVSEDGELAGMITSTDILGAVADGRLRG